MVIPDATALCPGFRFTPSGLRVGGRPGFRCASSGLRVGGRRSPDEGRRPESGMTQMENPEGEYEV